MFKIIGQPDDYSDVLNRTFLFNWATGIVCTFYLAKISPFMSNAFNALPIKMDALGLKDQNVLYLLCPLLIAIVFRFFKLHDRLSDVLYIRHEFDLEVILRPLLRGVGYLVPLELSKQERSELMYNVFYKYASFHDGKIDQQLIRTALDNWGWLWVTVESCVLFFVTAMCFLFTGHAFHSLVSLAAAFACVILYKYQYRCCTRSASAEVTAILADPARREDIRRTVEKESCVRPLADVQA